MSNTTQAVSVVFCAGELPQKCRFDKRSTSSLHFTVFITQLKSDVLDH